jgi:sugar transferase EpsL
MTQTHSTQAFNDARVASEVNGPTPGWLGAFRWVWSKAQENETLVIPIDSTQLVRVRRWTTLWHGRGHILYVERPPEDWNVEDALGVVFSSSDVASACLAMGELTIPWTVIEMGSTDSLARWRRFGTTARAHHSSRRQPSLFKRGLDVCASAIGLCLLSPLLVVLSIAVAIGMGRPVLFRQARPGRHGEVFHLLKFRTMRTPKPGEEDPRFDGDRITRLGAFLRRTSLDELPTLLNVLKGDMSLVGPRPLLTRYLARYSDEQARRHHVRPGITGWAQINGRNAISWPEKFKLDVWYVDHQTFWLDLRILLRTVKKVFVREGISSTGHATMPEFMGDESPVETSDIKRS